MYWEIGCWSWDVCAGTIIAREAGAKVYGRGGRPWKDEDLMDHYFFVVRAIGDTSTETGSAAQNRIAKEFFACAEEWEVVRVLGTEDSALQDTDFWGCSETTRHQPKMPFLRAGLQAVSVVSHGSTLHQLAPVTVCL